jgi:hypothetical protein
VLHTLNASYCSHNYCSIKLVKAGVISAIQSHPIPYADLECILDTLLRHPKSKRAAAAEGHASSTKGGPKEGSSGRHGAQPTKQSTERLNVLAMDLGLTSAKNTPSLTEDDRVDLGTFDELTRCQALIHQVLGVEEEIVNKETWNYDTSLQLSTLARLGNKIPFRRPVGSMPMSAPSASAKGKERAWSDTEKRKDQSSAHYPRKKRSVYSMLPGESTGGSLAQPADPLPAMTRPEQAKTFEQLFPVLYPNLFGDGADHHCTYRSTLFDVLRKDCQNQTTQDLSSMVCYFQENQSLTNWQVFCLVLLFIIPSDFGLQSHLRSVLDQIRRPPVRPLHLLLKQLPRHQLQA